MNELAPLEKIDSHSLAERQELVLALEKKLLESGAPALELPLRHHFSEGTYLRELEIPKGVLIVGKIHKYRSMNLLIKGEISIFCPVQGKIRIKAPHVFVSEPGAKRVIFAHEDSIFCNAHGTPETDPEKIEEHFIAKTFSEVPQLTMEVKKEIL